jgi:hypothetical protein
MRNSAWVKEEGCKASGGKSKDGFNHPQAFQSTNMSALQQI